MIDIAANAATESDNRPQILLIHGAFHGSWVWQKVLDRLAPRDWRVQTVDLPSVAAKGQVALRIARRRGGGSSSYRGHRRPRRGRGAFLRGHDHHTGGHRTSQREPHHLHCGTPARRRRIVARPHRGRAPRSGSSMVTHSPPAGRSRRSSPTSQWTMPHARSTVCSHRVMRSSRSGLRQRRGETSRPPM